VYRLRKMRKRHLMQATDKFEIRQLSTLEEFAGAVRLQKEIWGFEEVDLLPRRLFVVASHIGGQVLGAYEGSKMIAFCLCLPALKHNPEAEPQPYLHSQMLGVLPEYHNSGLGRRLKWAQRLYALGRQVELIEWTFDPLQLKNAFFNIERLGAIVRRYVHNQYGTTTSHLHGGLPTDRLVPEWWLNSARVQALAEGGAFERPLVEARVPIPAHILRIVEDDPREARRIQASAGEQFEAHFRAGLAVTGFEKTAELSTYLLSRNF
jgi:predicted GNAT superfamily acetyltransferase